MTIKLHAMVVALAVRDACKRDVEKDRPIDNLYIDAIVERALREAAGSCRVRMTCSTAQPVRSRRKAIAWPLRHSNRCCGLWIPQRRCTTRVGGTAAGTWAAFATRAAPAVASATTIPTESGVSPATTAGRR